MSAAECVTAARRYAEEFGWPVTADGWAVWTLAGESVGGIAVPQPLAERVLGRLGELTDAGPVVETPGSPGEWVFLVQPRPWLSPMLIGLLAEHDVRCSRYHERIELPPTRVPDGTLRWVQEPEKKDPPQLARGVAVAGAVLRTVLTGRDQPKRPEM